MPLRVVEDRCLSFLQMHLIEGEGDERDVKGRSGLEGRDDVLVSVAGKRAAVVPGHGEVAGAGGRGVGHDRLNAQAARGIPEPVVQMSPRGVDSGLHGRATTIPAVPDGPGSGIDVRQIQLEDLGVLSVSLARAFFDDPVSQYLFPDRRTKRLERYFRFQLKTIFLPRGEAWTTPDLKAASMWIPPNSKPPSMAEGVSQLPVLAILGRRTPRALRVVQMLEPHHPRVPHFYLATVGTDPELQGKGYGSALLRVVLQRCDIAALPSYVESSQQENLSFYHRHGFEVVEEVVIPRTDVKLWLMWREPHAA
jgi:ribosomal protein S18 acetylase RimI-like enzyme